MKRGVLPVGTKPTLYLADDRVTARVEQGEIIFGTSLLTDDHRLFAKIVHKALADAGVDFYYVNDLLAWAVGPDYQAVPLAQWADRIRLRSARPLSSLQDHSVYAVFRTLAAYWKSKRGIQVVMSTP